MSFWLGEEAKDGRPGEMPLPLRPEQSKRILRLASLVANLFSPLRMTIRFRNDEKTGSRSSPSEANRGDVHLHRMSQREKSCPDGQEDFA